MRELLYHAYLRYPRAFFDRHATGQVLSRATNDLYPIRYFIGWGLVQGMQSLMMIVGGRHRARDRQPAARPLHGRRDAADHRARAALRAPRLAALAPGAGAERRRDGGSRRGRRRNRDGAGVRPRGRRPRPLRRQGRARARHRAAPGRGRGEAPARPLLPAVALDRGGRVLRRPAGDRAATSRSASSSSSRRSCSSSSGRSRRSAGSRTSGSVRSRRRVGASRGSRASSRCPSRRSRSTCRRGPLGVRFESVQFAYGGETGVLRDLDLVVEPGEIVAVCGPDRLREDVAPQPAAAILRPHRRAACSSAASTRATCRSQSFAQTSRS